MRWRKSSIVDGVMHDWSVCCKRDQEYRSYGFRKCVSSLDWGLWETRYYRNSIATKPNPSVKRVNPCGCLLNPSFLLSTREYTQGDLIPMYPTNTNYPFKHSCSYWKREWNDLTPIRSTTTSTRPSGVYSSPPTTPSTSSIALGHSCDKHSTMCVICSAESWLKFWANSFLFSTDGILWWTTPPATTSHPRALHVIPRTNALHWFTNWRNLSSNRLCSFWA